MAESASDVIVVGGGVIGLAIALELRLQGATVTLVSRNAAEAAAAAAAGMLAPQAEQIAPSPLLDLCLRSRDHYPDWTDKLAQITGLDTGYWACGILAPVYEPTAVDQQQPQLVAADDQNGEWLDRAAIHQHQPGLSDSVSGGWWYPQDAQVDNRLLVRALLAAVQHLGVEVHEGVAVTDIARQGTQVTGLQTTAGTWQAAHYVLATGAWSQDLLPLPVYPKKGQMMSVRVPADLSAVLRLQTVLFGSEIYLVPRRDGRIVIGATSEAVGFTPNNTAGGVQALLTQAIRLLPELAQSEIDQLWWGFRPATPDELPILGASPYTNLTLATGHYRNGILLTPITAQMIADHILRQHSDPLMAHFHWSRFQS